MLKYEVNYRDLESDTVEIPIINYEMEDNPDNDELTTVTCYYDDDIDLRPETPITISTYYDVEVSTSTTSETRLVTVSPAITELNTNFRYFSFDIDRYFPLSIRELQIEVRDNVPYIKFIFNDYHYFSSWDEPITFYVDFYGNDGLMYEKVFEDCEWEDEYTLVWRYNSDSPDIDLFMCNVFHNDTYTFVGYEGNEDSVEVEEVPEQACFTDEIYIKKPVVVGCDNRYEYYVKNCNDGDVNGLTAYRDQFISEFTVYAEIGKFKIIVPLSQMHDVTLQQEDNVINRFVNDEVRRSINSVVEMERYVYHPVFQVDTSPEVFETQDIYKIKFNLHFRQHRGEDWSVDDNTFWNGVDNDSKVLEENMGSATGIPYFSYANRSNQSDLLTYLGFTNGDVKYQKSKLKKSFLRVMVYDSDNPANQNLLTYANIFMDGGALFTKFMNHTMTNGYEVSEGIGGEHLTGTKVDREYVPQTPIDDDEMEKYRLSSQIVVMDTYSSGASSEGFNIYLWADNDQGFIPTDLYLKFEFNHAGYGRTIPFMMPYYDFEKDNRYGIKTFEEIMTDWRDNHGYGIRKYTKYSYIHIKCRYDKIKEKRVYYLDPDTYGNCVKYNRINDGYGNDCIHDNSQNELEINLYEAKVTFFNENDETT